LNWGYWGSVGAVASEHYRAALASLGIGSIEPREGIEAVERVLAYQLPSLTVLKVSRSVLQEFRVAPDRRRVIHAVRRAAVCEQVTQALKTPEAARLDPPAESTRRELEALIELERFARVALVSRLHQQSVLRPRADWFRTSDFRERLRIVSRHERLVAPLLALLEDATVLQPDGDGWRVTDRLGDLTISPDGVEDAHRTFVASYPELAGHAQLLRTCVQALPAVLRGETAATDVMFPAGSLQAVEKIYRGTPLSDYFNRLAGFLIERAVALRLRQLPPGRKLCVVEVGAGTGGTSDFVAAALVPHGDRVDYVYSDVSAGFKAHFQNRFASRYPFMRFANFDLERSLDEQELAGGSADVVLAANALHVGRSLQRSLQLVKGLLTANGILTLIEATRVTAFNTLTYGLLDGWWHFEDGHRRLPRSPLLDRRQWQRVLVEEGYRQVTAAEQLRGVEVQHFQTLLLAESDGAFVVADAAAKPSGAQAADPAPSPQTARLPAVLGDERPPGSVVESGGAPSRDPASDQQHRQALVEDRVAVVLKETLRLEQSDLSADTPFDHLGVDSIVAVGVVESLNQALGIQLRPVDLFNYSTVRSLSERIVSTYGQALSPRLSDPGTTTALSGPEMHPAEERRRSVAAQTGRDAQDVEGSPAGEPEPVSPAGCCGPTVAVVAEPAAGLGSDPIREPIAIVGISGRFPGASNVAEFWANLAAGKHSIRE
ncbi:MAG: methyltransferase, partial [Verrucomicrobia bacterium]|nr:methyltransferase [Verrucomicrobiota bacterium]